MSERQDGPGLDYRFMDHIIEQANNVRVWQPIKTGPKDGTQVLLFGADGIDLGCWQDAQPEHRESGVITDPGSDAGWWGMSFYWPHDAHPTHWMPLPEPPYPLAGSVGQDT